MQLPPMLRTAYNQGGADEYGDQQQGGYLQHAQLQAHQQRMLMQQQQQNDLNGENAISIVTAKVNDAIYDTIDYCGNKFKKVAPYVNKTLQYGWVPLVVYFGLKQGTHKYYPSSDTNLPVDMMDQQLERLPSWTDAIPIIGSHGSPKSGLFPSH